MIVHVCMFKLKEENKEENIDKLVRMAEGLQDQQPVVSGSVRVNGEKAPQDNYDVCLIFKFNTYQDLTAYQDDFQHQIFKKYAASIVESRACIDYEC